MPKQSRGFWVCSFCSLAFDRFEEASYHEVEDCAHRYSPHPLGDSSSWPQQRGTPDEAYNTTMPPLSTAMKTHPQHRREGSSISIEYGRKAEQNCIPLLNPEEPSHLKECDSIACRSIELFEIHRNPTESAGSQSQLGLRCSFCADTARSVIPQNIRTVGDCVRQIAEQHLTNCNLFPQNARAVLIRALKQRQQNKEEGGPSWHEEENNLRALIDFTINRCRHFGVVDRIPPNSGITFQDSDMDSSLERDHQPLPISQAIPLSPSLTRRPSPLPDDNYRQTPLYSDRAAMTQSFPSPPYGHPPPPYNQSHSPYHQSSQPHPSSFQPYMNHYALPPDFPFLQERGGEWICKFCSHVHPQARDPKYYWMAPDKSPPPPDFIDHHLSICRVFQEHRYRAFDYQGPPPSLPPGPQPTTPPSYSPSHWDGSHSSEQHMSRAGRAPHPQGQYQPHPAQSLSYDVSSYNGQQPPPSTGRAYQPDSPVGRRPIRATTPTPASAADSQAYDRAVDFLISTDKSMLDNEGAPVPESSRLVLEEDRLLLTDYFFFVMKQLRQVRFSEADRKTRGGKRENIKIGYGGLQCVHCVDLPNTRKFFWSNVDRLANSFAEIPGHVLKCRRCPQPTKDALLLLKTRHPEQMARLPRGSQKVFFRRMWRRLHDIESNSPNADKSSPGSNLDSSPKQTPTPSVAISSKPTPLDTGPRIFEQSPAGTSGSEESLVFMQRSSKEAAKALAVAAMQSGPPSPSSRVLLAIPDDKEWLSDTDCFIRRQLEVFCATAEDVETACNDRKYPVREGQVGIRCIHCAMTKNGKGACGQAVAYPFTISGIYEAAREFQRLHLESCENLPPAAKTKLLEMKGSASLSSVLRKYYILAANALGLRDTRDGIRAGGESIPLGSQAAFAFSDESSPRFQPDMMSMVKMESLSPGDTAKKASSDNRKRSASEEEPEESPDLKRPAFPPSEV